MSNEIINPLVGEIRDILDIARRNVAKEVNNELIRSYWKIGEIIVRYEQNDNIRAEYESFLFEL
jgi:predicted transcriptional regulator